MYLGLGDNKGNLYLLDKRKGNKNKIDLFPAKSLKGNTGAVTDILNLGEGIIASSSSDRYLRIFNYKTYEDMPQIYLKSQLTSLSHFEPKTQEASDCEKAQNEESEGNEEENEEMMESEEVSVDWDNIDYEQSFDDDDFIDIDPKKKQRKKQRNKNN